MYVLKRGYCCTLAMAGSMRNAGLIHFVRYSMSSALRASSSLGITSRGGCCDEVPSSLVASFSLGLIKSADNGYLFG